MDFPRALRSLLLFFHVLVPIVSGQLGGGSYFTTPPPQGSSDVDSDNKVYHVGEKLQVQWQTNLENFALLLWQANTVQSPATLFGASPSHVSSISSLLKN